MSKNRKPKTFTCIDCGKEHPKSEAIRTLWGKICKLCDFKRRVRKGEPTWDE